MTNFIQKSTIKRLIYDIKEMDDDSLKESGIFYKHHETNMLKGYAMIIGNNDTPYKYGHYIFTFDFPFDYPLRPPTLSSITQGEGIRKHPNFYRSGKCCLSILNTWQGEQWSSCQSIKSILLTIASVLDSQPMLHEPGVTDTHTDIESFNKIVEYGNLKNAIISIVSDKYFREYYLLFKNEIDSNIINNYLNIDNHYKNLNTKETIETALYKMKIKIDYVKTRKEFKRISDSLIKVKS